MSSYSLAAPSRAADPCVRQETAPGELGSPPGSAFRQSRTHNPGPAPGAPGPQPLRYPRLSSPLPCPRGIPGSSGAFPPPQLLVNGILASGGVRKPRQTNLNNKCCKQWRRGRGRLGPPAARARAAPWPRAGPGRGPGAGQPECASLRVGVHRRRRPDRRAEHAWARKWRARRPLGTPAASPAAQRRPGRTCLCGNMAPSRVGARERVPAPSRLMRLRQLAGGPAGTITGSDHRRGVTVTVTSSDDFPPGPGAAPGAWHTAFQVLHL